MVIYMKSKKRKNCGNRQQIRSCQELVVKEETEYKATQGDIFVLVGSYKAATNTEHIFLCEHSFGTVVQIPFGTCTPWFLVHSPNVRNNGGWARLEPGAKDTIWVAHMGGTQVLELAPRVCISRKLGSGARGKTQTQVLNFVGCVHPNGI